eukprot:TRINITY_DN35785_c2_g2_i1.p1 TRINITY_DN35785_c2_g2~~TRINITY_DN35785_c2_g2_i1.p1  ORF type:complete len:314 (+),score=77.26 TRINITY_DN35785_c2_g2_i1:44-985(+)
MHGMHRASAATGTCRVRPASCPFGSDGVSLEATEDVPAGEALLVETPVLSVLTGGVGFEQRKRLFQACLHGSSAEETQTMVYLAALKMPFLRAYAGATAATKEKYLSLQTAFSESGSEVAVAVKRLAKQLVERDLCDGLGAAALVEEVLTCSLVNCFDFMPEGSDAVFYMGSLFQHSCEPNARFHVVEAQTSGRQRPPWVGEFRALRPIRSGEPVHVSYLPEDWLQKPRELRAWRMLKAMGFHCACGRCTREAAAAAKRGGGGGGGTTSAARDARPSSSEAALEVQSMPAPRTWADEGVARIVRSLAPSSSVS